MKDERLADSQVAELERDLEVNAGVWDFPGWRRMLLNEVGWARKKGSCSCDGRGECVGCECADAEAEVRKLNKELRLARANARILAHHHRSHTKPPANVVRESLAYAAVEGDTDAV